jgi:hypothetical protein
MIDLNDHIKKLSRESLLRLRTRGDAMRFAQAAANVATRWRRREQHAARKQVGCISDRLY